MDVSTLILYDLDDQREISLNIRDLIQNNNNVHQVQGSANNTIRTISVAKLFEKCLSLWSNFDVENLAFIVDGKIEKNDKEFMNIGQNIRVLYCLRLSADIPFGNMVIDPISLKAATEWADSLRPEDIPKHSELTQIIAAMKVNEPEIVPPQNQNANNNPPQHPVLHFFQIIQWRLIIRMCVIFYIFTGGRGRDEKKYFMAAIFFFCYLLQVGFLSYLLGKLRNAVGNPIAQQNPDPNQPQGAQPAGMSFLDYIRATITNGVAIPQTPGLLYDFFAFTIGLFASIFPSWEPQAFPLPAGAQQPPPVAAEPVGPNNENNQQPQPPAVDGNANANGNGNVNNGNPQVMNLF